jgi:hypothetical protein
MQDYNKTEHCPACDDTGDAHRDRGKGKTPYWYPCPVCNGLKTNPDPVKLKKWEEEK